MILQAHRSFMGIVKGGEIVPVVSDPDYSRVCVGFSSQFGLNSPQLFFFLESLPENTEFRCRNR